MMKTILSVVLSAVLAHAAIASQPLIEQLDVFVSGTEGYHTFRIPTLVVSNRGTVLAICEGRKDSRQDLSNVHLMVKRSSDSGKTWGPLQLIYKEEGGEKDVTCGNPSPVVDEETGDVHLIFCRDRDRVFVTISSDDGHTWTPPREITSSVRKPDYDLYWSGPGHGIQLKQGPDAGRLLIPCHQHRIRPTKGFRAHMLYSDDHGKTWQLGENVPLAKDATADANGELYGGSECAVVEVGPGEVYLNTRCSTYATNHDRRQMTRSYDGGLTWEPLQDDAALVSPNCHGNVVGDPQRNLVLFCNPANGPIPDWDHGRIQMTVRGSYDGGRSWPAHQMLHAGASSYADLAVATDGTILCLYEGGREHRREWLRLARFQLEWLDAGRKPTGESDAE